MVLLDEISRFSAAARMLSSRRVALSSTFLFYCAPEEGNLLQRLGLAWEVAAGGVGPEPGRFGQGCEPGGGRISQAASGQGGRGKKIGCATRLDAAHRGWLSRDRPYRGALSGLPVQGSEGKWALGGGTQRNVIHFLKIALIYCRGSFRHDCCLEIELPSLCLPRCVVGSPGFCRWS